MVAAVAVLTTYSAKNSTGRLGGYGQSSGPLPHHFISKYIQPGTNTGVIGQKSHPHEHGDNTEIVGISSIMLLIERCRV